MRSFEIARRHLAETVAEERPIARARTADG